MVEKVTKRTIWVAKCDCDPEKGANKTYTENPPRETLCDNCRKWITPVEESYTGKDKFDGK
jgi:hypothetical protein